MKNSFHIACVLTLIGCLASKADEVLVADNFDLSGISKASRFKGTDIDSGDWVMRSSDTDPSTWVISDSKLAHPGDDDKGVFLLNSLDFSDPSLTQVTVSFDYTVGAGSTLYFYSSLFTGGTTTTGNLSRITRTGGAYFATAASDFNAQFVSALNLRDGASPSGGTSQALASFAGATSGTFTQTYDISGYLGVSSIADVSHILAAFAIDTAEDGEGAITIDNVNLTAVSSGPSAPSLLNVPSVSVTTVDAIDYPVVSFSTEIDSPIDYSIEVSDDLQMWAAGVIDTDFFEMPGSPVDNGNGSVTTHLRFVDPINDWSQFFFRLRGVQN